MPITISLLISLCGISGAIAGLAILDMLLVVISGIVGASGLLLTQIMCRSMNRSLFDILLGKTTTAASEIPANETEQAVAAKQPQANKADAGEIIEKAQNIIIVPGYGMAIAQAQHLVKELADALVKKGKQIKYAIHPVAGRMPGHMNILLCEADVDYDDLYEMEVINPEFEKTDAVIIIGANDVVNPAAREAEGTPIYQMPILDVDKCPNIFIFNYDLKPGYSGVENPLYSSEEGVYLYLGNAADTLKDFIGIIQ
jgi:NAD(P) transhydrogenase subunit beta